MVALTCHPAIRLVPLTADLAAQMRAEASRALNGDGSCKLSEMHTSCFASETCARGGMSPLTLESMLSQPRAIVAVADVGFRGAAHSRFVGCVSAAPAQSWLFPRHIFEPGSTLVSNLCVSNAYRKEGVGRRLMDAVRAPDAPTYLLVAKPPSGASSDVRAAFESRVPRLRNTYHKLGFHECDQCESALLFVAPR